MDVLLNVIKFQYPKWAGKSGPPYLARLDSQTVHFMPSFIGILQHNITEFAQIDHENKLKQKNNVLFWIKFIAGKTTYVKYLIFSNSVQKWYDFQSHRTMRPQMQIFAHRAVQCAKKITAHIHS